MAAIQGFDEEMATELQSRARKALLMKEISGEKPSEDLLALEGMTEALAQQLASHGINTRELLAEQAVDDLENVEGLDEALAAKLIMKARAHWFTDTSE